MPTYSHRTAWDTAESSYAQALRAARASGRRLYDLTNANPTRAGFVYDADLLVQLTNQASLTYDPDPRGLLSAREAVAGYYADHGAAVSPDELILTTSTSESYSFLFRLLCDPGDEVLVAQPSYPLFDFLATLDDVRLVPYPLFYDHGWSIDFAELTRRITPRTRAILLVHPNNPTGHWTGAEERGQLEEVCAAHGLALIVDEVFLDYSLGDGYSPGSFAKGPHPVPTFVLSGLSKIAGLPQMKAAWLLALGPKPAKDEGGFSISEALARLEIIADTFLSMNAPVQLALPHWLASRDAIQKQIIDRCRAGLDALTRFEQAHPDRLRVLESAAGWAAVVSLPSCVSEADCAERLLRERSVVVHPGAFYGMPQSDRVVVSLLTPADELVEGIRRATEGS